MSVPRKKQTARKVARPIAESLEDYEEESEIEWPPRKRQTARKMARPISESLGPQPEPRPRLDLSEAITVFVGEPLRSFVLHKSVLTETSTFLAAKLNSDSATQDKKITLPNTDPNHFDEYLQWLYTGQIPRSRWTANEEKETEYEASSLFELYILGFEMEDRAFRNAVIDSIIRITDRAPEYEPNMEDIANIWSKTDADCPLRRLILPCMFFRRQKALNHAEDWPREFLVDLANWGMFGDSKFDFTYRNRCFFHDHKDGAARC